MINYKVAAARHSMTVDNVSSSTESPVGDWPESPKLLEVEN